jgi:cytochrome c oxidase subunit 3
MSTAALPPSAAPGAAGNHESGGRDTRFCDAATLHRSRLGMWVFLCTELMFFGPVFWGYIVERSRAPQAFLQAARLTDITFGTANTLILLTSSLFMALAVACAHAGRPQAARRHLYVTAALGLAFLAIKGLEYRKDWHDHLVPGAHFLASGVSDQAAAQMFFFIYFFTTLLHALHLIIGIVLVTFIARRLARDTVSPRAALARRVEMTGLYWHFVDIVWIFLFPVLYLGGRA